MTSERLAASARDARYAGDLRGAEALYRQALAADPADRLTQVGLGVTYLALGDYERGWPLYDARIERLESPARRLPYPEWRGEPVAGRSVLIFAEQGRGDQIQCFRFVAMLKAAGASRVSVLCWAPLVRLFAANGADAVFAAAGTVDLPRHDFWTLPFSAARYLYPTLGDVSGAPYLAVEPAQRGGTGYVWRGSAKHPHDANRSLPARPDLPGVDLTEPEGDFLDAARRIAGLDRVITVDTAMAHLAGALGVPCRVMLPAYATDWRWLRDRSDSPWYDSVTLHRQRTPGDWSEVLAEVSAP